MVPDDEKENENSRQALKDLLYTIPEQLGVYLFKDQKGAILYIGKASNLLKRVKSYFSPQAELSPKQRKLISKIADIDFLTTDSETEALILECQLIKKYRPKYNVRLKDDKTYPYLKIDLSEPYPPVYFTRRRKQDNARYFGPFASARSLRLAIKLLKKLFPFRSCTGKVAKNSRPCLEYDLGRCLAPCIGAVSKEEYLKTISQVICFLEGKAEEVERQLEQEMNRAAERLEFERAAKIRDQLFALRKVAEEQKIVLSSDENMDVISLALSGDLGCAQVFFIRGGRLTDREVFFLEGIEGENQTTIMTSFLKQFYHASTSIPELILLQHPIEERDEILSWLVSRKGGEVKIETPTEGEKHSLLLLCGRNAQDALEQYRFKKLSNQQLLSQALLELKEQFSLPRLPRRIECYDISDIQGEYAVGSLVVFEDGKPKPSDYRRYRIKLVKGIDDPAMLAEVLTRRLRRLQEPSWGIKPDLILIDGGMGQLRAALDVLRRFGEEIPAVSLAKGREESYLPSSPHPLRLTETSPALNLLRHIRDEAHRFALNYHLKVRRKGVFSSPLDEVPGIGAKRKKILLRSFGSIEGIREASVEEIASLPTMTRKLAEKIKEMV